MKPWGWRRLALTCLLIALWLLPRPALAQEGVTLDALTIELWPEYDRPSVLVILRGTLAPSVRLPATVVVHIPAASGGPYAVAAQAPNGQLLTAPYTTAVSGDAIAVSLQTDQASFQLEYYDPGLTIAEAARDYTFRWVADFPSRAASLRVQEPVDTQALSAEPAVTLAGSSDLGLNYYTAPLGQLSAGQTISVTLRYTKTTARLSADAARPSDSVAPVATASAPATAPAWLGLNDTTRVVLAGVLGLLSLALIGWGVVIWRRGAGEPRRSRRAREPAASEAARFCTQCGSPAVPGDQFCRQCGAKLRQ
jgi:hypothetical protein